MTNSSAVLTHPPRIETASNGTALRTLEALGRSTRRCLEAVGRSTAFASDTLRALADVHTWGTSATVQMRRLGVDSLPIGIFIAVFTGVVLALLASYSFTGAVPLYFVGTLV